MRKVFYILLVMMALFLIDACCDTKTYKAPINKRPKVVFHWGGGHQGANIVGITGGKKDLDIKHSTFQSVVDSLNLKYGKKKKHSLKK